jgi:hypothetical protein
MSIGTQTKALLLNAWNQGCLDCLAASPPTVPAFKPPYRQSTVSWAVMGPLIAALSDEVAVAYATTFKAVYIQLLTVPVTQIQNNLNALNAGLAAANALTPGS